jgi:cysteinyl-tRNA synthetase
MLGHEHEISRRNLRHPRRGNGPDVSPSRKRTGPIRIRHRQTFAKYWLHNGLTRIKTKLASGEWADEKMSGSLGNVVSARDLLDAWGPELLRYMLLSTHYRRPIEFTDEVLTNSKKGLAVFPAVRAESSD